MESNLPALLHYTDIARRLKIDRRTVADLVNAHEIPIRRHPLNGSAKCLDLDGFKAICEILRRDAAQSA